MEKDTQKIENSLNLALDATEEEREKSLNLNVGYDGDTKTWEVIVKYDRDGVNLQEKGYQVVELLQNYAIVRSTEEKIEQLSRYAQIEYIEKPKRLFFERAEGKLNSCISSVQREPFELQGEGVIIGILDSGIDYENQEFRNIDGSTRILEIWDQTLQGIPPSGYLHGVEYSREEINKALLENRKLDTRDYSGHGTEVATIAVGNSGIAAQSDIIAVKLGIPQADGFPRTTELMQGVDYLVKQARKYGKPLVINISIGNTYGSHDGSSLLERFMDDASGEWKTTICVGMGNEGAAAGHIQGNVLQGEEKRIELLVDRRQLSFDLQLWKYYEDEMEIIFSGPSGERVGPIKNVLGTQRIIAGETEILLYYGEPSPFSILQEIYFVFIPRNTYVNSGIWEIIIRGISIVTGAYAFWLPSSGVLNLGTQFNESTKEATFTIPATAARVISVGAYDSTTFTYADFSGRGKETDPKWVKPDVVAPGVRVRTTTVGGEEKIVSGTSFATPFVTGASSLLMEWGIVRENDIYLYGEKVKAYLRKGAEALSGFEQYPNEVIGYGRLCVEKSL